MSRGGRCPGVAALAAARGLAPAALLAAFAVLAPAPVRAQSEQVPVGARAIGWPVSPPSEQVRRAGAELRKPATLEFSYRGLTLAPGAAPALYAAGSDSVWRRIGGTPDLPATRVAATVDAPGRNALFAESVTPRGGGMLSALALTPRVFSPSGGFASRRIAIGFSLGRAAPVTVRIYNRAGRLVREVASGLSMGPGANLVYWDGRDRDGDLANEGLYLVTVEALDEKRTQTLAVVR